MLSAEVPRPFPEWVLHHEGGVVAVDKPPGMKSTGRSMDDPDCLQFEAMAHFRRRVWAVHQLDAETSGVLVLVLRRSLVAPWQRRLGADSTRKRYLAIVHGGLAEDEVEVRAPLGPDRRRPGFQAVRRDGKASHTTFRTRVRGPRHSLVEAELHTGRTHQIRVHLEHLGTRLVGEKRYGGAEACPEHPRHALHAAAVVFGDGEVPDRFDAPLPPDLRALAARLGLVAAGR